MSGGTSPLDGAAAPPSAAVPPVGAAPKDLASLLGATSEASFFEHLVGRRRLVAPAAFPTRAEALMPWWLIDRLVASSPSHGARLEVLRGGDVIAVGDYCNADGAPRADALDRLKAEGVSLLLHGVDQEVPAVAELSAALEARLGCSVWCNVYVTFGEGGALAPHHDDHDVLALQVHGAKRWFGHPPLEVLPLGPSGEDAAFGAACWDVRLGPGDLLFLPRGEPHHTCVEGGPSVHLTFGLDAARGVDWFAAILEQARRDPAFRADLPRVAGEAPLTAHEAQLKEALHALVDAADVRAFLRTVDAARRPRAVLASPSPPRR